MSSLRRRLWERLAHGADADGGFTLVELLVAMVLSAALAGIFLSTIAATQRSAKDTTQQINLTAEARTALNRMVNDLQAAVPLTVESATSPPTTTVIPAITAAANPDGPNFDPNAVTSITFNFDSNGDGCIAGIASNNIDAAVSGAPQCTTTGEPVNLSAPETETFCWSPATELLYLIPQNPTTMNEATPVTSCSGGTALLAGKITAFQIAYRSSLYRYQNASGKDATYGACTGTGTSCGVTTWYDLDAAGPPVGNNDGVLDMPELQYIDSLVITMTLEQGGHSQQFSTQVDLRNVHPNA